MDSLNIIYIMSGIIASLVVIISAIVGVMKVARNFTQSKQQHTPPIYIPPNAIKQRGKSRIKNIWVILVGFCILAITVGIVSRFFFSLGARSNNNPVSSVQNNCPTTGMARPAVMNRLLLHTNPMIVYVDNQGMYSTTRTGILIRYDVKKQIKTEIVKIPNATITNAQVSRDGQWILFLAKETNQTELKMIRIDGQYLQTLYCTRPSQTIFNALLSLSQKWVMFNLGSEYPETVYLLNISNGALQPELILNKYMYFISAWLSDTQVYGLLYQENASGLPANLFLLDTAKGAYQHLDNYGGFGSIYQNMSVTNSSDGKVLFISNISYTNQVTFASSSVSAQTVPDGETRTIFSSSTLKISKIRAISSTILLLLVKNPDKVDYNGLWKLNMNGSSLIRLTIDNTRYDNEGQDLNSFSQDAWSNVSRDGSLYALQMSSVQDMSYALLYGSLNGGMPTTFDSVSSGSQLKIIGWTTM